MRPVRAIRLAGVVITLLIVACSAPSAGRTSTAGSTTDLPWYRRATTRDFNADGYADSAVLVARGLRPDSLDVVLTLFVDGRDVYQEAWPSDYELIDVDSTVRIRPRLDEYIRARLDTVFASITSAQLDTLALRLMADSPAVLHQFKTPPTTQLSFSYGYESTVVLAWDDRTQRFIALWSCC